MNQKIKRLASVVSAVLTLAIATPAQEMSLLIADTVKSTDGLPIAEQQYKDTAYYWDNLLGEAGNFSLFAFDSIYNDTHVNGNIACKNWIVGQNYPEPHTDFGLYESHPLVNVVTQHIDNTADSVDFGPGEVKHPDNDDGKIWGLGLLNTIYVPEASDVYCIDQYGYWDPEKNEYVQIKDATWIYDSNGKSIQVRSSQNQMAVHFEHATESFIDFDSLRAQYSSLSGQLAALENNITPSYNEYNPQLNSITLNSQGTNVLNLTAAEFLANPICNINGINYTESEGYMGNQSLVVNIDLCRQFCFP